SHGKSPMSSACCCSMSGCSGSPGAAPTAMAPIRAAPKRPSLPFGRGNQPDFARCLAHIKEMAMTEMQQADAAEVRDRMWKKMADSPFVMIERVGASDHAHPMTAQLDKDAHGAFWFYTQRDNRLAPGGPAMVQFAS